MFFSFFYHSLSIFPLWGNVKQKFKVLFLVVVNAFQFPNCVHGQKYFVSRCLFRLLFFFFFCNNNKKKLSWYWFWMHILFNCTQCFLCINSISNTVNYNANILGKVSPKHCMKYNNNNKTTFRMNLPNIVFPAYTWKYIYINIKCQTKHHVNFFFVHLRIYAKIKRKNLPKI